VLELQATPLLQKHSLFLWESHHHTMVRIKDCSLRIMMQNREYVCCRLRMYLIKANSTTLVFCSSRYGNTCMPSSSCRLARMAMVTSWKWQFYKPFPATAHKGPLSGGL